MNKACLLLACVALGTVGCRPASDRTEARQAGAEAAGGATGSDGVGDPVKRGANQVTPETLPTNLVTADADEPGSRAAAANSAVVRSTAPNNAPTLAIPDRFHGRWGMVPADCTSTRGDAKGLITVDDRTIRFYESVATLMERLPGSASSFAGDFSFTGEGMAWTKRMTLMLSDGQLNRTEDGRVFSYSRCP